jgi:hypothetical protein
MTKERSLFWETVLRAVETEPRPATSILGASGLRHPLLAVGYDENRRRLVLVSGEHDARQAALAGADVHAALPSTQVIVARPVAMNLAPIAKALVEAAGKPEVPFAAISKLGSTPREIQKEVASFIERTLGPIGYLYEEIPMGFVNQVMQFVQQLGKIQLIRARPGENVEEGKEFESASVGLSDLAKLNPIADDCAMGVCPIPLYELFPGEREIFYRGVDIEAARELLGKYGVLQYFMPAADHLALGLIDRGGLNPEQVLEKLIDVPGAGHPFGPMELVPTEPSLPEVVASLQELGLVVETELSIETTPEGRAVRMQVKSRPREGILSKFLNRVSINIDFSLKDWLNR